MRRPLIIVVSAVAVSGLIGPVSAQSYEDAVCKAWDAKIKRMIDPHRNVGILDSNLSNKIDMEFKFLEDKCSVDSFKSTLD